jgi:uncharacterized membrane protein YhdT
MFVVEWLVEAYLRTFLQLYHLPTKVNMYCIVMEVLLLHY